MRAVTEFSSFTLNQAQKTQATLQGEGKSAEDIEKQLGENFRVEGDKLKYLISAIEVAQKNSERLKRVMVVSLAEGEKAPAAAMALDAVYLVPEFYLDPKAQKSAAKGDGKGGRSGRKGKERAPKSSPWGLSPEEKAAKNGKTTKPAATS